MAAGKNWKRPWEDDENGGYGQSHMVQDAPKLSGSRFGFESVTGHDGEQHAREGMLRVTSGTVKTNPVPSEIVSPSIYRHVHLNAKPQDTPVDHNGPSTSPSSCPKRRRLLQDELPKNVVKPLSFSKGPGLVLEGHAENLMEVPGSEDNNIASSGSRFSTLSKHEGPRNPSEKNTLVEMNRQDHPLLESSHTQRRCPMCSNLQGIVGHIIEGLCGFQSELSVKLASESIGYQARVFEDYHRDAPDVADHGLKRSLDWVLSKVNDSKRIVKDSVASENFKVQFPKETSFYSNMHSERFSNAEDDKMRQAKTIAESVRERVSPPQSDDGSRPSEMSRIHSNLFERRKSSKDFFPPNILPSPHTNTSLSTNIFTRPQSPMQAPSRLLPSPSSMSFTGSSILPPMSPSIYQSKSPQTAHLQELQHQLSTKSLAYQILQGEHDKLLAAFTRSQTRCGTLDRKSQASEAEINNLSEEQARMQSQIEAYENQIEDLQESRDEACRQSSSAGAQYTQIIDKSSKLQAKGVEDSKRWKEEKKTLEKEKAEMMAKIERLEGQNGRNFSALNFSSSQNALTPQPLGSSFMNVPHHIEATEDVISSTSIDVLREEIIRLRMINSDTQKDLKGVRGENVHIKEIISMLDGISRRIGTKKSLTQDNNLERDKAALGCPA